MAFDPGKAGTVLLRNSAGETVDVAGKIGKGRVALTGFHHGLKTPVNELERKLLLPMVNWLGEDRGIKDKRSTRMLYKHTERATANDFF